MPIQYDKLNEAKAMLRTLREQFLDGVITNADLKAQEFVIKNDIRVILGLEPLPPA